MFDLGSLGGLFNPSGAQQSGRIRRPSRRSALFGSRSFNKGAIPPPERKRERIEAARRKLVEKTERAHARSARDKAANAVIKAMSRDKTGDAA